MKILVLGSASAQGIPQPFCHCRLCKNAKGKDVRLRSSYLVTLDSGVRILLDASPDFPQQQNKFNFDFDYLFLSHRHRDHTQGLEELRVDLGAFAHRRPRGQKRRVFILGKVLRRWLRHGPYDMRWEESIQQAYSQLCARGYFRELVLTPFLPYHLDKTTHLTLIRGYHGEIYCCGLAISEQGKTLVYLADIGYLNNKLSSFLTKVNPDLIIAHTPFFDRLPDDKDPRKHLSLAAASQIPGKKILLSHFCHKIGVRHQTLVARAKRVNSRLIVAFDGQKIKV